MNIDINELLTEVIDGLVKAFAKAITPPGDNELKNEVVLYRAVSEAFAQKAEAAEMFSRDD